MNNQPTGTPPLTPPSAVTLSLAPLPTIPEPRPQASRLVSVVSPPWGSLGFMPLMSLQVICYVYFTRIIAILLRVAVPFQWQWLYEVSSRAPGGAGGWTRQRRGSP